MVEVCLSSSIICERYSSLCQLGRAAVAFCSAAKKTRICQQSWTLTRWARRSGSQNGMALPWAECFTSSTARRPAGNNSPHLLGSRHQQKRQTAPAFRVEKQGKPSQDTGRVRPGGAPQRHVADARRSLGFSLPPLPEDALSRQLRVLWKHKEQDRIIYLKY